MTDDPGLEPPPEQEEDAPRLSPPLPLRSSRRTWEPSRRTLLLSLAVVGPCAVIGLSIYSMARDTVRDAPPPAASSAVAPTPPVEPAVPSAAPVPSIEALQPDPQTTAPSGFYEETDDGEPTKEKPRPPKIYTTVQQAAAESCSTASVDGLSRQIIEQARCIKPNAFAPLPTRPNLVLASHVYPYLELEARNHLLRVLDAHVPGKMTINSALRTVAQQYLVWRWSAVRHCGVQLATPPGESNHEIGTALDIAEPAQWKAALESQEFHWLGASDRVHFDYKRSDTPPHSATDVLAFQILWNRNHPKDAITADGHYTPITEQRLKKSPPAGFAMGPACGKGAKR